MPERLLRPSFTGSASLQRRKTRRRILAESSQSPRRNRSDIVQYKKLRGKSSPAFFRQTAMTLWRSIRRRENASPALPLSESHHMHSIEAPRRRARRGKNAEAFLNSDRHANASEGVSAAPVLRRSTGYALSGTRGSASDSVRYHAAHADRNPALSSRG